MNNRNIPSPDTNPDSQLALGIFLVKITGLSTGLNSIKLDFKTSDNPALRPIDAFILIILGSTSKLIGYLFLKISTICLNKIKSADFCVNKR
jgi:hypothetical protein